MTPSPLAAAALITWRRNRGYAERLVGDILDEQMTGEPVPGVMMNHPAWILAHLTVYAPIAAALLRRRPFEDPLEHPYGQQSAPVADRSAYPIRGVLIREYLASHDDAQRALEEADEGALAAATPLARWREAHPTVGDMVCTLMVKHESMHLGQLSAWRRAMGFPRVAM